LDDLDEQLAAMLSQHTGELERHLAETVVPEAIAEALRAWEAEAEARRLAKETAEAEAQAAAKAAAEAEAEAARREERAAQLKRRVIGRSLHRLLSMGFLAWSEAVQAVVEARRAAAAEAEAEGRREAEAKARQHAFLQALREAGGVWFDELVGQTELRTIQQEVQKLRHVLGQVTSATLMSAHPLTPA
jgi:membrane protein involved in colicin uptake